MAGWPLGEVDVEPLASGRASSRPEGAGDLRERAQALAARLGQGSPPGPRAEDRQALVEELVLHQFELQIQNQDLIEAQADLEVSRARYFDLFERAPVAYLVLDARGMVLEANRNAAELLGRPVWFLMRQGLGRSIVREDHDAYYGHLSQLFATGGRQVVELRLRRPGRPPFWARLEASRDRDRPGAEARCLITLSDLSQAKLAEHEREARLAQAERLQSLGLVAGGVAHEVNNLLAAVLALASLHQLSAEAGGELMRDLDTIVSACLHGRTLVLGLLGFARQGLAEERVLDLNQVVREALSLLERGAVHRIGPELVLDETLPPVFGDPTALTHAVMNLCLNALEAMPDGGQLTVRTGLQAAGTVLLEVADTGPGMSEETMARALEPFFTTKSNGTGLGLTMALRAAKAHGGDLELHSAPGRGTTVRLRLPAHPGAAPAEPEPSRPPEPPRRPLRILLVDDSLAIQRSFGPLLERLGHLVTVLGTGREALAVLAGDQALDLAILDLNLPDLQGPDLLDRLRALRPGLPVLVATGGPSREALELVQSGERLALLTKPFTRAELQARLDGLGLS